MMRANPVESKPLICAEIRRIVDYCAKLGRRRGVEDVDLFTVLPTASRQFADQHRFGSSWRLSRHAATVGAVSI